MSIFSAIGSVFKTVGKAALGVVKTGVNVAGNAAGIGTIFNSNGGAQQAAVESLPNYGNYQQAGGYGGAPVAATPSLLDYAKYALGGVGDFLTGKTHAQLDTNVGLGGRQAGYPTGSGFPSWLPIAGIGVVLLLLLNRGGGRRY